MAGPWVWGGRAVEQRWHWRRHLGPSARTARYWPRRHGALAGCGHRQVKPLPRVGAASRGGGASSARLGPAPGGSGSGWPGQREGARAPSRRGPGCGAAGEALPGLSRPLPQRGSNWGRAVGFGVWSLRWGSGTGSGPGVSAPVRLVRNRVFASLLTALCYLKKNKNKTRNEQTFTAFLLEASHPLGVKDCCPFSGLCFVYRQVQEDWGNLTTPFKIQFVNYVKRLPSFSQALLE